MVQVERENETNEGSRFDLRQRQALKKKLSNRQPYGHMSLKVLNVEFDLDVSVDSMQLQAHTLKSHLHAMRRTRHFYFDVRF